MPKEIQRFDVGTKAFILNGRDEILLLREAASGLWELPGGRINVGEENLPLESVLRRELVEELGDDLQVEMGPLAHTWARERKPGDFVFFVGRLCRYKAGAPRLSDEHDAWAWATPREIETLEFVPTFREAVAEFRKQLPRFR
jgi:8-oxo-dGTP pyrophosphatase MutT (NUDIX family)